MIALVTGASSGIGKDISIELAKKGYDIILVARNIERLQAVKETIEKNFNRNCYIKTVELSDRNACIKLHEEVKNEFGIIDILINNAGFGLCGKFKENDLNKEISMIDTNITSLHILTKLFLQDMDDKKKERHIMNVASIAGFMPGPLMATYYATKSYVVRLSQALNEELKSDKSKVKMHVLCPGPVDTNFNKTAEVRFSLRGVSSEYVADYAVRKMFKNKLLIFPGIGIKISVTGAKFLPANWMAQMCFSMQKKKL